MWKPKCGQTVTIRHWVRPVGTGWVNLDAETDKRIPCIRPVPFLLPPCSAPVTNETRKSQKVMESRVCMTAETKAVILPLFFTLLAGISRRRVNAARNSRITTEELQKRMQENRRAAFPVRGFRALLTWRQNTKITMTRSLAQGVVL
jgi:hypothetical protein